jgi:hypothetical protein
MEAFEEIEIRSEDESVEDHPLYIQGLSHLQKGEWQEAVSCLSLLEEYYPDSVEVQTLLEEARWKASLDEQAPQPKIIRPSLLSNRLVKALLVANLLVYAGWGIFAVYAQNVRPALQRQREEAYQTKLLEEGERELAAGNYGGAIQRFQELLVRSPGNSEAQAGLAEAQEMAALAALYEQAVALVEAEQWPEALILWQEIAQRKDGYKDVAKQIAFAERQITLAHLLDEAEAFYHSSYWPEAAAKYEEIRAIDLSYQQSVVEEHLLASYLNNGEALVDLAGEILEPLIEAVELFEKALALRPLDSHLLVERSLAKGCLEGSRLYEQGDWAGAIAKLQKVYEIKREYAKGRAAQLLYEAHMARGNEVVEEEAYPLAQQEFSQALEVATQMGDEAALMLFEAQYNLAEAYAKGRETKLASQHYQEAFAASGLGSASGSGSPFTTYLEGAEAAVQEGNYAQALKQYRQALESIAECQKTLRHTVQPGETLSQIAFHYHTPVGAIVAANNLQSPSSIQLGQQLTIPVSFDSGCAG